MKQITPQPGRSRSQEPVLAEFQLTIGKGCRHLVPLLGDEQATSLAWWIENIFDHDDSLWNLLYSAFATATSTYSRTGTDPLHLSSPAGSYAQFKRFCYYDESRIDGVYGSPPGERTRRVYDTLFEGEDLRGWNLFLDQAHLCATMNAFQLFWIWLVSELSDDELKDVGRGRVRLSITTLRAGLCLQVCGGVFRFETAPALGVGGLPPLAPYEWR